MHLGDLGFILAFIILPILIVIGSVSALRSLSRRARPAQPDSTPSWDGQPQRIDQTEELPVVPPAAPPRDWAATVRPIRGQGQVQRVQTEQKRFRTPLYRGRSAGTVRRLDSTAIRRTRGSGQGPSSSPRG